MGQIEEFKKLLTTAGTVGLDTNCFIYHFSQHRQFGFLAKVIIEYLEKGKIEAVTSIVTVVELLYRAEIAKREKIRLAYKDVMEKFPHLRVFPAGMEIGERAASLRFKYNFKTPDAIQLATAIIAGAKAFVTNDRFFEKAEEEIKILTLADFI